MEVSNKISNIFKIQKLKKTTLIPHKTETLKNHLYDCVYAECKESFPSFKQWKFHFDRHVNNFY